MADVRKLYKSDKVTSTFQTIESVIGSAVSWIVRQIQSVLNLFSQVNMAAKSMTSGSLGSAIGGALGGRRAVTYSAIPEANPAFSALYTTPIPKLATGAVIPANKEFLAVLGDQKHGTNIEAPLDMIEQASEKSFLKILNRFGSVGNSDSDKRDIIINIDGREVFRVMLKEATEYKKQTGRSAFI